MTVSTCSIDVLAAICRPYGGCRVINAKVFGDGSMKIRNAMQSRQRIRLEGNPPQRDGFEPDLRGAREIDLFIQCAPDEPGVLPVQFSSEAGGKVYSKATGKRYR
jgi:hypothetical protein